MRRSTSVNPCAFALIEALAAVTIIASYPGPEGVVRADNHGHDSRRGLVGREWSAGHASVDNGSHRHAVRRRADAPLEVFGSAPANPMFGQPLESNGGFENQLADWQIVAGLPLTLTADDGKGLPSAGLRFFHAGLNNPGDCIVRQDIDLIAAGFAAQDIDDGAVLDAEAYLRNWYAAGTFDDQVYYRVAYLDETSQELASVHSLIAADDDWLLRRLSGLVPPGTRTLRVELHGHHRRGQDNDSMADDLTVRLQIADPIGQPAISKLPMLQDVRCDAMTLIWETDQNLVHHALEWGVNDIGENTISNVETLPIDDSHFVHRVTVQPLEPQATYRYRVRSGETVSAVFSFRTAPRRMTPFSIAWLADNQDGPQILTQHVAHMAARHPDLLLVAGDIVQHGNNINEWQTQWFDPLEISNLAQTTPVLFARGNHDDEYALAYAYSALPGNESWHAFTYGNTRFIMLDTEAYPSAAPQQRTWLESELAGPEAQSAPFRIVAFHRPPFTDLWDDPDYNGEAWVRNYWVSLFETYHVDLVIGGHAHAYERGDRNGVTYLIVGGGGGALDLVRSYDWGFFDVLESIYHYTILQVSRNTLTWSAYDLNDDVVDSFVLFSQIPLVPGDTDADGDVDDLDLDHFRDCLTGADLAPPTPECDDVDLDGDGDVDQSDFGFFQRCLSGESIPADPNCAG